MSAQRRAPPPGLPLRLFYRTPVLLYRIGLGGFMPMQMLLTTVGRKSGKPRRTAVDVVRHDAETDTYYAVSAYGDRSDWYRNLLANPTLHVQTGRRKFEARATVMPDESVEALLIDFWRGHRLYVRTMFRIIGLNASTEDDFRASVAEMKVVAIQPEPG